MRLAPRIRVLMVVLALVLLVAGGVPGPSVSAAGLAATPAPLVVSLNCGTGPFFPAILNVLSCTATVTGGAGIYTYTWFPSSAVLFPAGTGNTFLGYCTPSNAVSVSVSVTDVTGAKGKASAKLTC